jgi:serine/threonine protein kinase
MNETSQNLNKGTNLQMGKYAIVSKLGSGGFGITYKAKYSKKVVLDEKFNKIEADAEVTVAIKELFIKGECIRDIKSSSVILQGMKFNDFLEFKKRFLREAETLQKLDKVQQVVKVIDFFEENNTAYMVMGFIEGKTLKAHLAEKGILTELKAIKYLKNLTEGLKEIHENQIIHRDIKPDNIIINSKDEAVLIDFGTAKEFMADKTAVHSMIFTPNYASPEQYSQKQKIGAFTDIYALGCTLYYCLTGKPPYSIQYREKGENIEIPGASASLENLIGKMMLLEASKRPQNATELLKALEDLDRSTFAYTQKAPPQKAYTEKDPTWYQKTKHLKPDSFKDKDEKRATYKHNSFFKKLASEVPPRKYLLAHLFLVIGCYASLFAPFAFTKTDNGTFEMYSGLKLISLGLHHLSPSEILVTSLFFILFLFPLYFLVLHIKRFKTKVTIVLGIIYTACIAILPFLIGPGMELEWGVFLVYLLLSSIVFLFVEMMFATRLPSFMLASFRIILMIGFIFLQIQLVNRVSNTVEITWSGIQINNHNSLKTSQGSNFGVRSVTVTPDEEFIITSGSYITLLDAQKDSVRWKNDVRGSMQAFASPNKKQIIALDSDNLMDDKHTLKFMDIATGKLRDEINLGTHFIRAMALNIPQNMIAFGGFDRRISLLNLKTNKITKTFGAKYLYNVLSLFFDKNGDILFSGHTQKKGTNTLFMWDVNTGKVIKTFDLQESAYDVKGSPDGKFLATATKTGIYIFDIDKGSLLRKLEEKELKFMSIDFHPTKLMLASVGQKGTNELNIIHVWRPLTGKVVKRIDQTGTAALRAVRFKNKDELITSSYGGKTTIWPLNF